MTPIDRIESPQVPYRGGHDALSLRDLMARYGVHGLQFAVVEGFEVVEDRVFGEDWIPGMVAKENYSLNTQFRAASISKPVTAMCVLKAAQEGLVDLEGSFNDQLKCWNIPGSQAYSITPRMLLSHCSGLDHFDDWGYPPGEVPDVLEVLEREVKVVREPGLQYNYSNLGYTLLHLLLEDVTSDPFYEVAAKWVFAPLEMQDSTFDEAPLAARAYDDCGKPYPHHHYDYEVLGAAGLWTTAGDLCKFAIEVMHGQFQEHDKKVLWTQMARQMTAPYGNGDFCAGFRLVHDGQGWYMSHRGSAKGYRAYLRGHIRKGYAAAVLVNGNNGEHVNEEVMRRIQNAYGWDCCYRSVDEVPVTDANVAPPRKVGAS
jgi:CubicO group peptidase (beta-lactamase class C family)